MFILIWCIVGFIASIINILLNYFIDKEDVTIKDIELIFLGTVLGWLTMILVIGVGIMRMFEKYGDNIIFKAKK